MKRSIILFLSAASLSLPYSYSLFGPMTGERTLSIAPAIAVPVYPTPSVSCSLRAGYGMLRDLDIVGDIVTAGIYPGAYIGSSVMPRFHFGGGHTAALALGVIDPGGGLTFYCSPQYHWYGEGGPIALTVNASIDLYASRIGSPMIAVSVAPEFRIVKSNFHIFVELSPSYTVSASSPFSLSAAPGVWISIGDKPAHRIIVSLPIRRLETAGSITSSVGYEVRVRYESVIGL